MQMYFWEIIWKWLSLYVFCGAWLMIFSREDCMTEDWSGYRRHSRPPANYNGCSALPSRVVFMWNRVYHRNRRVGKFEGWRWFSQATYHVTYGHSWRDSTFYGSNMSTGRFPIRAQIKYRLFTRNNYCNIQTKFVEIL